MANVINVNLKETTEKIKEMCDKRNVSIDKMLKDSQAGTSTVDNMKRGSAPSIDKIIAIANYFDCSVDYLLGRTDTPNGTSIRVGDINGNNNSLTDSNNININNKKSADNISEKFMAIFNNLPFEEQLEIMNIAVEKSKNKE